MDYGIFAPIKEYEAEIDLTDKNTASRSSEIEQNGY